MDGYLIIKAIGALLLVLALMAVCAVALRRFGRVLPGFGFGLGGLAVRKDKRLVVLETALVDSRHRLALISRDGVEHLLLLSTDKAIVVEAGCAAAVPVAS